MIITRKNLSIRPTQHGVLFLAILIAMLGGSINYNNNAGFILVFLLGGMALISLFHSFGNLTGLEAGFFSAPPVFKGNDAVFHIRIHPHGMGRVMVGLSLPGSPKTVQTFEPNVPATVHIHLGALKRGLLTPEYLQIESVYPFGLFTLKAKMSMENGCLVYPMPVNRGFSPLSGSDDQGRKKGTNEGSRQSGADDFQGLILYQPGHDVGRMAWKAVSRGQGLFIKDFTSGGSTAAMIDYHALPGDDMEIKLSWLCQMVLDVSGRQQNFGLKLPGKTIHPATGAAHTQKCLRQLALFTPGIETGREPSS